MVNGIYLAFRLFEIVGGATGVTILAKELLPLQNAGLQKCMAFSFDGSKLAVGGVVRRDQNCFIRAFLFSVAIILCFTLLTISYFQDGCLRIMEWPNLRVILDEPKAHKSIRDMDFR